MSKSKAQHWRRVMKPRFVFVALILLAWSGAIEGRLVYLQIYRHDALTARAEDQQHDTINTSPKRGEILDRHGRVLAYSVEAYSVGANPRVIDDPVAVAASLCEALNDCTESSQAKLVNRLSQDRAFVYVQRKVTPEQFKRIAGLNLEGIDYRTEDKRFYPNKELAAHVLGYVGIDNDGLSGVEAVYDSVIKGRPGTILIEQDAREVGFSRLERPPTTGATLELTIDRYLQYVVERELRSAIEENNAAGGAVVIMDPQTGEILALANAPTFNPNTYQRRLDHARRNRAVQDYYEPGSTFKLVTAAAAFEEEVVLPEEVIDLGDGKIQFGSRIIEDVKQYGDLSFTDVIVKSSNVGVAKVSLRLGAERLILYAKRFGFGRPTSPDFAGESPGNVWDPSKLDDSAVASVSMGYQVGVTLLQMAAAVSVVANGGELYEPHVVRAVIKDGRRSPVPHKVVRRAISKRTAEILTEIMEQVVERGTGTGARLDKYRVAGKTGTSAQLDEDREYSESDYIASFVGFVPSRQPIFTIVAMIESPRGPNGYYGGRVVAPMFKKIAETALLRYGVPPTINTSPLILVTHHTKRYQQQASDSPRLPAIVLLHSDEKESGTVFPNLKGLSARDAIRVLVKLGMNPHLHGAGVVVAQQPEVGTSIEIGSKATLWLGRIQTQIVNGSQP